MKRIFLAILFILPITIMTYGQDFYWYKGKQIPLRRGNQKYILYEESNKKSAPLKVIEGGEISCSKTNSVKWGIIGQETITDNAKVSYQIPSFLCSDTTKNMFITHRFYVKLNNADDLSILRKLAMRYNATIEKEGVLPLWYVLKCGANSKYNALELANIFYESGLFAASEPEFIHTIYPNCVNDSLFFKQWNLKNTGQYIYNGIDINYCSARSISRGDSSVIIAVFDWGVDLTHPDINIHPTSYNAHDLTSPSQIYEPHGTACAGIISAKTNNNLGVAGIAPLCPVMSISMDYSTTDENIAAGFVFAANHNCAVINNSWTKENLSTYVENGISYALEHGRNGKGCVVLFCSGNVESEHVRYPANCNPDIITVGAISPDGKRKQSYAFDNLAWGSSYGEELDIMAPGSFISTTDEVGFNGYSETNYTTGFFGTSAACPHVAAVAGLILSVNPYLTQKGVADIIESTAQKIGGYSYSSHSGRSNGSWNKYMGYGLLDAYAAVFTAKYKYIQGPDYICYGDTVCYQLNDIPPGATCTWSINSLTDWAGTYRIVQGQGTTNLCVTHTDPYPSTPVEPIRVASAGDADLNAIFPPVITISNSIKAVITMEDNSTYTVTKKFHKPKGQVPTIESSSTAPWKSGQTRYFTITNNTSAPGEDLLWEIMDVLLGSGMENNDTTYSYDMGGSIAYTPYVPNNYLRLITITATNTFEACGEQSSSITIGVSPAQSPFLLSAAVESKKLNIAILQEDEVQKLSSAQLNESSVYTLELSHSIYGSMRTQQVSGANQQINTVGLPKGVYVLILKENNNIIAQTKVQIQ
ncbi:MAG: S8 family serine peptidase [Paludibacteraceae bacterium]|nr:S8 family serine peptidase [Paludibacteraceae bacterium]